MNHDDLHDRVVAVTGAGRGIGREIAIDAARAGARIAAISRTHDELDETVATVRRSGGHAVAFAGSVTDPARIGETFAAIDDALGPVHVLVNCAGALGPLGPFAENDIREWWDAVDVNLRGAAMCMRAVLPAMIRRRDGRIVNVASGGAATAMTYFSSYIVAKTALVRLTECLAPEVRAFGLSVFAIGPGTVRTAMTERSLNTADARKWIPWFRRIFDERFDVPASRAAGLVTALASGRYDALSGRFITIADNLDSLMEAMPRIDRDELYTLRVNRLASSQEMSPASRAIADAAIRPAGLTLRLERQLPLTTEEAFAAWIDPAAVARWFIHGTDVRWAAEPEIDARAGHGFRFRVIGDAGPFDFSGRYRQVTPPARLQFTWRWESIPMVEGPGDTSVTVEFSADAGFGTRVTLVQEQLPNGQAYEAHQKGWERCLDGIASLSPSG